MKIFLLFLFVSTNLLAFERKASESQFKFPKKSHDHELIHKLEKDISSLLVLDKKRKIILKRTSDYEDQSLVDAHVIKFKENSEQFVLALWYKGAHGQRITITSLESKKDVFQKNSSWPLDYKFEKNKLMMNFLGDTQKNGLPEKKVIVLTQKDLIK